MAGLLADDELPRRGGPRTPAGRAASCRNSTRHGLSATALLPDILGRNLVNQHFEHLWEEWQPETPTEGFFVRELARHLSALERIQEIEDAVLRRGARGYFDPVGQTENELDRLEAALAAAGTSDAVDKITRYRRSHERAFERNYAMLKEAKSQSTHKKEGPHQSSAGASRAVFMTEAECELYLVARQADGQFRCPRCEARAGHWIASRKVWQCRQCKGQSSLRAGTVMAGSRLTLLAWFRAIEALLHDSHVSTSELIAATGVQRASTVRKLACRIRRALLSSEASMRLAGLDRLFVCGPAESRLT